VSLAAGDSDAVVVAHQLRGLGAVHRVRQAGRGAFAAPADVTDRASIGAAIGATVERYGRLDTLITSAGIQRYGSVADTSEATWDEVFAVNVKGVWLGAKYALAVMKKQKRGVFLVTASTAAIRPRPGGQTYAASKGAVVTLTKSLALECAPYGVRVVAIAPVATETPMLATFMGKTEVDAEGMARYIATVPLGRLNKPEDLAQAAVFLASDEAAMITGACLEVDGGRCI